MTGYNANQRARSLKADREIGKGGGSCFEGADAAPEKGEKWTPRRPNAEAGEKKRQVTTVARRRAPRQRC